MAAPESRFPVSGDKQYDASVVEFSHRGRDLLIFAVLQTNYPGYYERDSIPARLYSVL